MLNGYWNENWQAKHKYLVETFFMPSTVTEAGSLQPEAIEMFLLLQ
jgi:hypothetical protein